MLKVQHIGSKWAGEQSDTVADLLKLLETEPLDPRFEEFGNFVWKLSPDDAVNIGASYEVGGNFYGVSSCFSIFGDTKQDVAELRRAIRRNQRTPAYLKAKQELAEQKAVRAERQQTAKADA